MTSILFPAARIIDGTESKEPYTADLLVEDGLIVKIGAPGSIQADDEVRIMNTEGCLVCPGFIDMHAHSDLYLLTSPTHEAKITQGCTTEVIGQDGISYAPVHSSEQMRAIREQIAGWNGNPSDEECTTTHRGVGMFEWRTIADYLDTLERNRTATNVAMLVPQGNLRLLACGPYDAPASTEEIDAQITELRKCMNDGAVGLSSGLTYTPGMYATDSELAKLCEVLAKDYPGAYYAPHHRGYGKGAIQNYREMLVLGRETGCPVHLTHATLNFAENKGRAPELISMVDDCLERGLDVTHDTYPYLPGCTTLAALLPSWASSGGPRETLKRLQDAATRDKIRIAVEIDGCDGGHGIPTNWEEIQVGECFDPSISSYSGRRVADIADSAKQPCVEVFFDILEKEKLATSCLMHIGNEENVQLIMQHRVHMSGSDAILHGSKVHPRAWGTFSRYLGHYARDVGLLPLPDMVAHLTSRPAKRLGVFPHRGCIREGSAADLVVFDPETIKDMATYDEPKLPSKGIRYVLVNGQIAVDEGKVLGIRAGKTLRRRPDGTVS